MTGRQALLATLCCFALLSACATQSDLVAKMFRTQTGCSQVKVQQTAKNQHDATGCGQQRAYRCNSEFDTITCEQLVPEPDPQAMAVELVTDMYRRQHKCVAASITPLGEDRYEARGCGPVQQYRCHRSGDRVTCQLASE